MVEMAATEAPLRELLRNLRIICPFCFAKDRLCGFDYLEKKVTESLETPLSFYGGDGGNRNRVRKSIPATFYERSLSFKIPLEERR